MPALSFFLRKLRKNHFVERFTHGGGREQGLDEVAGWDADTGFLDDFGCLSEDRESVFIEGDSNASGFGCVHDD